MSPFAYFVGQRLEVRSPSSGYGLFTRLLLSCLMVALHLQHEGPVTLYGPLFQNHLKRLGGKSLSVACICPEGQTSGVGDHPGDLGVIAVGNVGLGSQLTLHLGRLRGQDVALLRLAALDLAGASLGKTLLRPCVGFQLGHLSFLSES